jgi:hypothetical protein
VTGDGATRLVGRSNRAAAGPQESAARDVADLPPMRKPLLPDRQERTVRWLLDPAPLTRASGGGNHRAGVEREVKGDALACTVG